MRSRLSFMLKAMCINASLFLLLIIILTNKYTIMIKVFKMMRLFGFIKVINNPEYYHKKWDYLESIKKSS